MTYSTSYLRVSTGKAAPAWRQILVVSDTKPISFPTPGYITRTETVTDDEEGTTYTTVTRYFTTGNIFRHVEENGTHYYWFILIRVETETLTGDSSAAEVEELKRQLEEQKAINDILTGGDGSGTIS